MKNITLSVIFFIIFCSYFTFAQNNGSFIVKFKKSSLSKNSAFIQSSNLKSVFNLNSLKKTIPYLSNSNIILGIDELETYYLAQGIDNIELSRLANSEDVEFVEPNYIYKIENSDIKDPSFDMQWALKALNAPKVWEKSTGKGIVVAVIDTGIEPLHEDLVNQLWVNSGEDLNGNGKFDPWWHTLDSNGVFGDLNGIDDDGNGFVDDIIGYDFCDQLLVNFGDASNPDPFPYDENGHGTLVSGVIAAERNELGIVGLAYDSKIMTLRAFDVSGNAESDDIAACIVYAAANGAKIMNFSFGESFKSELMHSAIKFAQSMGCIMVSSSGNANMFTRHFPSDFPEVISVGAITSNLQRWGDSNYGSKLDLMAPGVGILTTDLDNSYRNANGTSFAAPHVAATAALLLELKPQLTPIEVKSIMKANTRDMGIIGWDSLTGAGMLDPLTAVNNLDFISHHQIISPKQDDLLTSIISIEIDYFYPLIDSLQILVGTGLIPNFFVNLKSIVGNSVNSKHAINFTGINDTLITISTKAFLKNGRTIEEREYYNLSNNNNLLVSNAKVTKAWFDGEPYLIASSISNLPAFANLSFESGGIEPNNQIYSFSEYDRNTQFQQVLLPSRYLNGSVHAKYSLKAPGTFSSERTLNLSDDRKIFPQTGFSRKTYSMARTYLCPQVYEKGDEIIIFGNNFSDFAIGTARVYSYNQGEISQINQKQELQITRGVGDSNNDGIPDFITTVSGSASIYQFADNEPFGSKLFESNIERTVWGAGYHDFDGDGIPEAIFSDDTSYAIAKFRAGTYEVVARTIGANRRLERTDRAWTAGDFDGNGKQEIAFLNNFGQLHIFEYDGVNFVQRYIDESRLAFSNQQIASGDINGDGIDEIFTLNYGTYELYGQLVNSNPLWTLRGLRYDNGQYTSFIKEHFIGVKDGFIPNIGVSFRNGLAVGNLDTKQGAEIVVMAFPNTYIFTSSDDGSSLIPMWWYDQTISNDAIIADFDKNGKNELVMNTFAGVLFYEHSDNQAQLSIPSFFKGSASNSTTVRLDWSQVEGAESYEIFELIRDEQSISISSTPVATSNSNFVDITGLIPLTQYEFTIRAIANGKASDYSFPKTALVYTKDPLIALNANFSEQNKSIEVEYDSKLDEFGISPLYFTLISASNGNKLDIINAVNTINNKAIISFTQPVEAGNYILEITPHQDYFGSFMQDKAVFELKTNPMNNGDELYGVKADLQAGSSLLYITFSDIVDNSATDPNNYELMPYGEVFNISILHDRPNAVQMNVSSDVRRGYRGFNYSIKLKNISSISGKTMTEGTGSVLGFVVQANNLDDLYVYPSPVKLSDNENVMFAGITIKAKVNIYNSFGNWIKTVEEYDGNGGVEWDLIDSEGKRLSPGVYLYEVEGIDGNNSTWKSDLQKFMVVP